MQFANLEWVKELKRRKRLSRINHSIGCINSLGASFVDG